MEINYKIQRLNVDIYKNVQAFYLQLVDTCMHVYYTFTYQVRYSFNYIINIFIAHSLNV